VQVITNGLPLIFAVMVVVVTVVLLYLTVLLLCSKFCPDGLVLMYTNACCTSAVSSVNLG